MRKPHTTDDKMLDSRPVFEFVVVSMWLRRLNYDASGGWASDERKKGWLAATAGKVIDGRRIRLFGKLLVEDWVEDWIEVLKQGCSQI